MNRIRPALCALIMFVAMLTALTGCRCLPRSSGPDSWTPLFNGRDLDGWYVLIRGLNPGEDPNRLVQAHDGAIHMYRDAEAGSLQPFGVIVTRQEYSDYRLRFEYKWAGKKFAPRTGAVRDAGLLYHVVGQDVVWPRSVECQIQEGDTGDIFTVRGTQVTTTVTPATAVKGTPRFLEAADGGVERVQGHPTGISRVIKSETVEVEGWNTVEVVIRGDSAVHIINGKVNNRATDIRENVDGQWVALNRGKIALQLEGAEILYRNIEIQPLAK